MFYYHLNDFVFSSTFYTLKNSDGYSFWLSKTENYITVSTDFCSIILFYFFWSFIHTYVNT